MAPTESPLISHAAEANSFWRMRGQMLRTSIGQGLSTARLRIIVFLIVSVIFWAGLYWLFYEGFVFLVQALTHEGARAQAVRGVFNVFFLALLVMLTFSSGIILYSTLYRSEEINFLLTTTARPDRILLHKLQEAVLFSSWGFVLLGAPLLMAYGVASGAPWYYHAMLAPFMLSFVVIPTSIGAIGCMLLVRLAPNVRLHGAFISGAVALLAMGALGYWLITTAGGESVMTPEWFQEMISRLRYSEQRILPSWWLSTGLLEAAHPSDDQEMTSFFESMRFLGLLVANALFFQLVAQWVAKKTLRTGFSSLRGVSNAKRQAKASLFDRGCQIAVSPLRRITRGMLLKDLRIFRRDPVQWGQFAIFFSLLTLYFLNIRRFQDGTYFAKWAPILGFINVAVVGLILSTFTTRFIFPLISLEGRRIWILGTLPIDRGAVLWGKFLMACFGSLPACSLLILISDFMLGLLTAAPDQALVHQLVCWLLCFGLSALAVGLGARFPNLREPSPSKIAAGFGGTLNLVLSALFIIVMILFSSVPYCSWAVTTGPDNMNVPSWLAAIGFGEWYIAAAGLALIVAIGITATVAPLRIGLHAFRKMEY